MTPQQTAENTVPVEDEIGEDSIEYKFDLTFYGADYPVDGLVKRLGSKDIVVPSFDPNNELAYEVEAFQRKFIWTKNQCDRFVESLLLGLPVPGIFLVQQSDKRLLVLDGQQRLLTMKAFYDGVLNKKEFALEHVQEQFRHKTYKSLGDDERRTLDDAVIHATVIKKTSEDQDLSSIYTLFERLNSGGTTLSPHEIRVALAPGELMRLVRKMNESPAWRKVFGPPSKTLKDHELILRFIALMFSHGEYESPMKTYLTNYAKFNQNLEKTPGDIIEKAFLGAIDAIVEAVGNRPFRISTALNAAVFDSVMVGIARRLTSGEPITAAKLADAYERLLSNGAYQAAVAKATARLDQVQTRLALATDAFRDV